MVSIWIGRGLWETNTSHVGTWKQGKHYGISALLEVQQADLQQLGYSKEADSCIHTPGRPGRLGVSHALPKAREVVIVAGRHQGPSHGWKVVNEGGVQAHEARDKPAQTQAKGDDRMSYNNCHSRKEPASCFSHTARTPRTPGSPGRTPSPQHSQQPEH